jgi:hypothetical protein
MWRNLELHAFYPKEARQAVDAIVEFNETLTKLLKTTKAGLEIARALAALASADPLELALRAILKEIEELIDALLGETTAHALVVPIQKQYYGLGDPIPPDSIDASIRTPDYGTLLNNNAFPQSVVNANTPDVISFINTTDSAQGGNRGYYGTVITSLNDPGDYAKPDFPQDFAVAGVSIVFGSTSLTDIYKIVALIGRIIDLGIRSDLTSRSRPVPTGLKARIMPEPTEGKIGVQLDWDPVPPVLIKPLLSLEKAVITEIFVIRSTNSILRERFTWNSNFIEQPADDINAYPSTAITKVIARLRNDGFRSRFVDTSSDLKVDTPYYYALALRYKINGVFQPMSDLSNSVRVYYTQFPGSSRQGTPPDWFATPSLYQMFPILRTLISKIELFVEGMLNRTASNNGIINMIEQTISQIEALIAQAEQLLAEIKEITDLLQEIATADIGGLYATSISVTTGGILGWTSELARRLSNTQDTSRPPFDESELVAGLVLVAGAPNFADLAAFVKLIKLFFGGDKPSAARKATDAFVPGRTSSGSGSGALVLVPTVTYFDKGMVATTAPTTTPAPDPAPDSISKTKPVFDTTMKPATKLANC